MAQSRVTRKLIITTPVLLILGIIAQLILLVFAIVLLIPFLIWPGILDKPYLWFTHGAAKVLARNLVGRSKPKAEMIT